MKTGLGEVPNKTLLQSFSSKYKRLNAAVRPVATQMSVGLEIETERFVGTTDKNGDDWMRHWMITNDGSLRGGGVEWILNGPMKCAQAVRAYRLLADSFRTGRTPTAGYNARNSLHVHVNATKLTAEQIKSFIFLYVLTEPVFIRHVHPDRINNMFCVPAYSCVHAYFPLFREGMDMLLRGRVGDVKYSALNVATLWSLGSLEFRMHGDLVEEYQLVTWLNLIGSLYNEVVANSGGYDQWLEESSVNINHFYHRIFEGAYEHPSYAGNYEAPTFDENETISSIQAAQKLLIVPTTVRDPRQRESAGRREFRREREVFNGIRNRDRTRPVQVNTNVWTTTDPTTIEQGNYGFGRAIGWYQHEDEDEGDR